MLKSLLLSFRPSNSVYWQFASLSSSNQKTAAALIIASEVLTGKVKEKNSHTLAKTLFERGVHLHKVEIIHDIKSEIIEAVRRLSESHDYVFTSGGIGSTHDDITYESIAEAFNRKLELHEPTLTKMRESSLKRDPPMEINEARKRMAYIPSGSQVLSTEDLWAPLVVVNNVYILPGISYLFEKMLLHNKEHFKGSTIYRDIIYTKMYESDYAEELRLLNETFKDKVSIGSYPTKGYCRVSIEGYEPSVIAIVASKVKSIVNGTPELAELGIFPDLDATK